MYCFRQMYISAVVCLFVFVKVVPSENKHVPISLKTSVVGNVDTKSLIRDLKRSIMYQAHRSIKAAGCENGTDNLSPGTKISTVTAEFNMRPVIKELKRMINYHIQTSLLALDFGMSPNQSKAVLSILSSSLEERIMSSIDSTLQNLTESIDTLVAENSKLKLGQKQLIQRYEVLNTINQAALQGLARAITDVNSQIGMTSIKLDDLEKIRKQEDADNRLKLLEHVLSECPHDWSVHGKSCYKVYTYPKKNWENAQTACQNYGVNVKGKLAEIETEEESIFVRKLAKKSGDSTFYAWIGGTKKDSEYWYWTTTKAKFTYTDWAPGRPIDKLKDNAVDLHRDFDFKWHNANPIHEIPYLCEISLN